MYRQPSICTIARPRALAALAVCLLLSLFVASAANAASNKSKKKNNVTEWYLKTTLSVVNPANGSLLRDTRSGLAGQLAASEAGYDPNDVAAYASATGSKAAIVFVHGEDWGEQAGEYLSDYRKAGQKTEDWPFTVYSSLDSDEVTLEWTGLFVLEKNPVTGAWTETHTPNHEFLKKLHLVDLETGEVINAVRGSKSKNLKAFELNSHTFSMEGQSSRRFRWVLGDVEQSHFETSATQSDNPETTKSAKNKSSLQALQQSNAASLEAGKFGTPPGGSQ